MKAGNHKVAIELQNIIEELAGVQLCMLFLLQGCLTVGTGRQLLASSIVPTVQWYYDEIHFSICILKLTTTGLLRFH